MIILYTTERDYPWGTLRSTHASKTKVVLEEKEIPYRIENLPPGNLWKKPPEMVAKHPPCAWGSTPGAALATP